MKLNSKPKHFKLPVLNSSDGVYFYMLYLLKYFEFLLQQMFIGCILGAIIVLLPSLFLKIILVRVCKMKAVWKKNEIITVYIYIKYILLFCTSL